MIAFVDLPDVLIITSADGAGYARGLAAKMSSGLLLLDDSLETPETGAEVIRVPFREKVGAREAALYSMLWFLNHRKLFPVEAMIDALTAAGRSKKVKTEKLLDF